MDSMINQKISFMNIKILTITIKYSRFKYCIVGHLLKLLKLMKIVCIFELLLLNDDRIEQIL